MGATETSPLQDLGLRLATAEARLRDSVPPFYKEREKTMPEPQKTVTIPRDAYCKELQELRRDVATLHNHKELVAYSALTLNVGAVAWLINKPDPSGWLVLLLLGASCLLHFMMRFQLIHRWHCTQFYQIYRTAIQKLYLSDQSHIETVIVNESDEPAPSRWEARIRYIVWTRRQAFYAMTFNYPTTLFLHEEIKESNRTFFRGRRRISYVEIVPTLASLACIGATTTQFPSVRRWLYETATQATFPIFG